MPVPPNGTWIHKMYACTGPAANLNLADTKPDPDTEASMWVPQEAAGLCRRFLRDFDGYR